MSGDDRRGPMTTISIDCYSGLADSRVPLHVSRISRSFQTAADLILTVRGRGLEPPLLSEPEPKSGASTSFATLALGRILHHPFASHARSHRLQDHAPDPVLGSGSLQPHEHGAVR